MRMSDYAAQYKIEVNQYFNTCAICSIVVNNIPIMKICFSSLFLLVLISAHSHSATWQDISEGWQLDTASIVQAKGGKVRFWVREKSSPEKIANLKKALQQVGENKNFSKYAYTSSMFQLNCAERKIGLSSVVFYDKSDRVIFDFYDENPTMEAIAPNSQGENIIPYVCKQ